MKVGDVHDCQHSQQRVKVVRTHDGPSWHLEVDEESAESWPIGWCPWCGVNLWD